MAQDKPVFVLMDCVRIYGDLIKNPSVLLPSEVNGLDDEAEMATVQDMVQFFAELDPFERAETARRIFGSYHPEYMASKPILIYSTRDGKQLVNMMNDGGLSQVSAYVKLPRCERKEWIPFTRAPTLPTVAFLSLKDSDERSSALADLIFGTAFDRGEDWKGGLACELAISKHTPKVRVSAKNECCTWQILNLKGDFEILRVDPLVCRALQDISNIVVIELLDGAQGCISEAELSLILSLNIATSSTILWRGTTGRLNEIAANPMVHVEGKENDIAKYLGALVSKQSSLVNVERALSHCFEIPDWGKKISAVVKDAYSQCCRDDFVLAKSFCKEAILSRDLVVGSKTEAQESSILSKIRGLRDSRKLQASSLKQNKILCLAMEILSLPERDHRLLGMLELQIQISLKDDESEKVRKANVEHNNAVHQLSVADSCKVDSTAMENLRIKVLEAKSHLLSLKTSSEHIWRELSHLHINRVTIGSPSTAGQNVSIPRLAAKVLHDGGVIELMDGDAACVPLQWMGDVLKELNNILSKGYASVKIFVVSLLGVQSTGKSTLINTMFGCNMRTSVGACTRGVNMALVPSAWNSSFTHTLVLDSEGICNPLFAREPWYDWHNNRLATFVCLVSNACILMNNNEDDIKMREILPISVRAYQGSRDGLSKCGFKPSHLFVVYNRIEEDEARKALEHNTSMFMKCLNEEVRSLKGALREHESESSDPDDTPVSVSDSDFLFLGHLHKRDIYGKQVAQIRQHIHSVMQDSGFEPLDLISESAQSRSWWSLVEQVTNCLNSHDWVFSFSNIAVFKNEQQRRNFLTEQQRSFSESLSACGDAAIHRIQSLPKKGVPDECIHSIVAEMKANGSAATKGVCEEVRKFLESDAHKHVKNMELEKWDAFVSQTEKHFETMVSNVFRVKVHSESKERELKQKFRSELKSNVRSRGDSTFEKLFSQFISEADQQDPPINVVNKVVDIVRGMQGEIVAKVDPVELRQRIQIRVDACSSGEEAYDLGLKEISEWEKRRQSAFLNAKKSGALSAMINGVRDVITGAKASQEAAKQTSVMNDLRKIVADSQALFQRANCSKKFEVEHIYSAISVFRRWDCKIDNSELQQLSLQVIVGITGILCKHQSQWDSKNRLPAKLKAEKDIYHTMFRDLCNNISKQERYLKIMISSLKTHFHDFCANMSFQTLAAKVWQSDWFLSPVTLHKLISLDIIYTLDQQGPEEALRFVMRSKTHCEGVIDQILRVMDVDPTQKINDGCFRLVDLLTVFKTELETCLRDSQGAGSSGHFVRLLDQHVSVMKKHSGLSPGWLDFIEEESEDPLDVAEWLDLCGQLIVAADGFKKCAFTRPPTVSYHNVMVKVQELYGRNSCACSEVCPFCGMTCNLDFGHSGEHSSFHQPLGLYGTFYHGVDTLSEMCCQEIIRKKRDFIYNGKTYDHSRWKESFPGWSVPSQDYPEGEKSNQELRIYMFNNFQGKLSELHRKKPATSLVLYDLPTLDTIKSRLISDVRSDSGYLIMNKKWGF